MISSYGKIYALGHRMIADLFKGPVSVEEKVDGSQFSFGVFGGQLHCRSKGLALDLANPDKMFTYAVQTAQELAPMLRDGWTYRGEYLRTPKHNTLAYDRVPTKHVILFDVDRGGQDHMPALDRWQEAERLGLESVPVLHYGEIESPDQLFELMDTVSVLGGQKIEGMVFKNLNRFGEDANPLRGKFVSERFKEIHHKDWKDRNPNRADVLETIIQSLRTESRWEKAIQHLAERGELDNSPKDIGALMRELESDLTAECTDYIKDRLYAWARKDVMRGVSRGLPEWYKERLAKSQFQEEQKS